MVCKACSIKIDIFHKVSHQKYLLFSDCKYRTLKMNQDYPNRASTDILNALLADQLWLAAVSLFFYFIYVSEIYLCGFFF